MAPEIPGSQEQEQTLGEVELKHKALIERAVVDRLELIQQERDATAVIAALCQKAIADGVRMNDLADWVKIMNPDGSSRSVTRQAVDLMLAKHEGRHRSTKKTRRAREKAASNGGETTGSVVMSAFE